MVAPINNNLNTPFAASFNLFNQSVQKTAQKDNQNGGNPAFTSTQAVTSVNPFVNAQPVTQAAPLSNKGGQYEKYAQYDNKLEGNGAMLQDQFNGYVNKKPNFCSGMWNA